MWTVLPPFQNRAQIVCKERLPLFQQQSSYKQVAVVFLVSCSASSPSDLWVWIIQGFYYTSSFSKLVVVLLLKRVRLEPEGKSWWKLLQFHTTLCAKDWTATIATRYTFTYFSCTLFRVSVNLKLFNLWQFFEVKLLEKRFNSIKGPISLTAISCKLGWF